MRSDIMTFKGFNARIMETDRLVGDFVHGLPPGRPLEIYSSDEFIDYPKNWMRGPGVFVVPVRPEKGLWWDWTANDSNNTAVLPTVKGCNPITGQQTSGFHMERYDSKCPKHGCEFQGDRYCPECDYKWPFGNYVASPNTLWLDGFLNSKDGTVRQFFFTEEEMRDIATRMIGKENTVPAFGFAFYRPKEMRPKGRRGTITYKNQMNDLRLLGSLSSSSTTSWNIYSAGVSVDNSGDKGYSYGGALYESDSAPAQVLFVGACACSATSTADSKGSYRSRELKCKTMSTLGKHSEISDGVRGSIIMPPAPPVKEVSIGAGAKIRQNLLPDSYPLDSWKDIPDAVMTIYFVFKEKLEELKAGGMRDLSGKVEGMLSGMPVG